MAWVPKNGVGGVLKVPCEARDTFRNGHEIISATARQLLSGFENLKAFSFNTVAFRFLKPERS
ncbi:MAG: hypothetical protein PHH59_10355 [Methylovulum sp.]|uniref:hypothetical protein n=1 Tax=Methylovulum sp. TaxID=1916980 RepID=UPI00261A69C4|nr:hypothetical protein [Methylovulum sp.]MDD2724408.1 hypothetical protein [Methylovulum sp.]MDD5124007.1 hypothetical protein [Methylovulum sp.]